MIVYAAMACPGSCAHSPLKPARETLDTMPGAQLSARTAEQAQEEVDAAAAAVEAAAVAALPEAAVGEDAATRPPLTLPQRVLPEASDTAGRIGLFGAQPLAGLRVGVFQPVGGKFLHAQVGFRHWGIHSGQVLSWLALGLLPP
jgi:hypothetical protein